MKEKILWFIGGAVLILAFSLASVEIYGYSTQRPGGRGVQSQSLYRLGLADQDLHQTGGPIRVLAARQADVEITKEITEADVPPVAMTEAAQSPRNVRNR